MAALGAGPTERDGGCARGVGRARGASEHDASTTRAEVARGTKNPSAELPSISKWTGIACDLSAYHLPQFNLHTPRIMLAANVVLPNSQARDGLCGKWREHAELLFWWLPTSICPHVQQSLRVAGDDVPSLLPSAGAGRSQAGVRWALSTPSAVPSVRGKALSMRGKARTSL